MNLHLLIPTLRQCCSLALSYHEAGIINDQAASLNQSQVNDVLRVAGARDLNGIKQPQF